jgi:mannose-6-phosphate isomerase-like protein (cupin superfamily)
MTTTSTPNPTAVILAAGEGETLRAHGNLLVMKTVSPRVSVIDYTAPAGFPGPPLHVHPGFDEVFFVLEGSLSIRVSDQVTELGPGASATVHGQTPHTFANESPTPVRFVLICAPGGFEDYFRALAGGDTDAVAAVSERFGYKAVPSA